MEIAFNLLREKELLYFGIHFCSFHCGEMLSWRSSANTWGESGVCHCFFPCFEKWRCFVTGHLNCLELPGTHVIISLCSEMPTFTFHFAENLQAQIIQLLKWSGGSVLCLNLLLQTAPDPEQDVGGKAFNKTLQGRVDHQLGIYRQVSCLDFSRLSNKLKKWWNGFKVSVVGFCFPFIQMLHWNIRIQN